MRPDTFTPGPWSVDETPVDYVAIRGPSDAPVWLNSVAEIDVLDGDDEQERVARANARLIAAAPELYTVLDAFLSDLDESGDVGFTIRQRARALLNKVEGLTT